MHKDICEYKLSEFSFESKSLPQMQIRSLHLMCYLRNLI